MLVPSEQGPTLRLTILLLLSLTVLACGTQPPAPGSTAAPDAPAATAPAGDQLPLAVFYDLLDEGGAAQRALDRIESDWRDTYASMLLDLIYFSTSPEIDAAMTELLGKASGLDPTDGYDQFYRWIWSTAPGTHPRFAEFRATLYAEVDPPFRDYFDNDPKARIRLDEILWGGVNQDGIPPLDQPGTLPAAAAGYLDDDDVVFGVFIDGEARAYPKRILAWHELVRDKVGGREITGVYCTLCGAMILYDSTVDGVRHEFGTSGFLYRSNKLMYDRATSSLWSTLTGEPVVGPLVGRGIELTTLPVVTSSWGEWRRRHPVHHDRLGTTDFVVLTDPSGANRVFATQGLRFARWNGADTAVDVEGNVWRVTERVLESAAGRDLPRLPAHRSFWFGWYAQFPQTRLVK